MRAVMAGHNLLRAPRLLKIVETRLNGVCEYCAAHQIFDEEIWFPSL